MSRTIVASSSSLLLSSLFVAGALVAGGLGAGCPGATSGEGEGEGEGAVGEGEGEGAAGEGEGEGEGEGGPPCAVTAAIVDDGDADTADLASPQSIAFVNGELAVAINEVITLYTYAAATPASVTEDVAVVNGAAGVDFWNRILVDDVSLFASSTNGSRVAYVADVTANVVEQYFDLQNAAAYEASLNLGVNAFVPHGGAIATDGATLFIVDQTHGGVVAVDVTTLAEAGSIVSVQRGGAPDSASQGTTDMFFAAPNFLVLVISRNGGIGVGELRLLRVLDVSDPAAMTLVGDTAFTTSGNSDGSATLIGANLFVGDLQAAMQHANVNTAGAVTVDGQNFFAPGGDRQFRGVAGFHSALIIGSPKFTDPADRSVFVIDATTGAQRAEATLDPAAGVDRVVADKTNDVAFLASGGTPITALTLTNCE